MSSSIRTPPAPPARPPTGGDPLAFTRAYGEHHVALHRYCRAILRNEHDAQDALQNAVTKAYAAWQRDPRVREWKPWLFRIAHNEAISLLRTRRAVDPVAEVPEVAGDTLSTVVERRERLSHLDADLVALPEKQRAALVLRELNGLGHDEIAEVLGGTARSIKQTIYEARVGLLDAEEGRAMTCDSVQIALSDGDGRVRRGRRMRGHLRTCKHCRGFAGALERRPGELAALAPVLSPGAAAALLAQVLGGGAAATGTSIALGTGLGIAGPAGPAGLALGGAVTGGGAALSGGAALGGGAAAGGAALGAGGAAAGGLGALVAKGAVAVALGAAAIGGGAVVQEQRSTPPTRTAPSATTAPAPGPAATPDARGASAPAGPGRAAGAAFPVITPAARKSARRAARVAARRSKRSGGAGRAGASRPADSPAVVGAPLGDTPKDGRSDALRSRQRERPTATDRGPQPSIVRAPRGTETRPTEPARTTRTSEGSVTPTAPRSRTGRLLERVPKAARTGPTK